jgi:hypothetical protein
MQVHKRLLVILGFFFFAVMIFITSQALPALQNQEFEKTNTKTTNADDGPIVDFQEAQPADAGERAKRRLRGAKHDKSLFNVDPADISETTVLVDSVDPNLPALPLAKSSIVVLGSITAAKAYLSNDRTGVYTEFSLRVEEVIKSDMQSSLVSGCTLEIIRNGGRVKFSNGRLHLYKVSGLEMPRVGARYVFFLMAGTADQGFEILTAYELRAGKVIPLDKLDQSKTYQNTDQTVFLNELRIKIAAAN